MDLNSTLYIVNAAFNVPLFVVTIVGNTMVLVSIARTPSLISPSNILLFGLAFSDLCVGVIVQPLYIVWKLLQFTNSAINFGTFSSVQAFFASVLCAVSFSNVTLLCVDRYLALHLHLRYKELVTVKRTGFLLGIIWLGIAVLVAIGMVLRKSDSRASVTVLGSIIIVANAILYCRIYRIVRRHQRQIHNQLQVQSNYQSANICHFKKSFINMFCVYLIFAICYLPYIVMCAFRSSIPSSIFEISWTLIYVNSLLNPVLFAWRVRGIREAIKNTVQKTRQKLYCAGKNHSSED